MKFNTRALLSIYLFMFVFLFTATNVESKEVNWIKDSMHSHMNILKVYKVLNGRFDFILNKDTDKEVSYVLNDFQTSSQYLNGYLIKSNNFNGVESFVSGIVVYKGAKKDLGNLLIIKGEDDYEYHFGVLESINVDLYDVVTPKDIIASASSDGTEDMYVYYLAIKSKGEFIDIFDVIFSEN